MPVWQALHEELGERGFVPVTVALDQSPEAARPYIERARPTHPALVDTEHVVADLFNIVNVPTMIWIDEQGRIVRPNEVAFGADTFKDLTGFDSEPYLAALRAWVIEGKRPFGADEIRELQMMPTAEEQLAKAEFGLGWYLHRNGRTEAAARHFARAGLLPKD